MAGTKPNTGETRLTALVQSIRELFEGRSHAVGELTLTPNATSTTVDAPNCGVDSRISLHPRTAHAATALATTYITAANTKPGQFIVTHANTADVDKSFAYSIRG